MKTEPLSVIQFTQTLITTLIRLGYSPKKIRRSEGNYISGVITVSDAFHSDKMD
jgi:hypothetical protein